VVYVGEVQSNGSVTDQDLVRTRVAYLDGLEAQFLGAPILVDSNSSGFSHVGRLVGKSSG
jgi:hypothetical protein